METMKKQNPTALVAGGLMALLALRMFVYFVRLLSFKFIFANLIGCAVLAFLAVMLLMKRRDKMLLIALSAVALDQLIWGNVVSFVAAAFMLLVALVATTEYLPQAKELVKKIWFVPAILIFAGSFIGLYRLYFMVIVWALVSAAAYLLCTYWLVYPESDIAELFSSAKSTASSMAANEASTVAEAEVDGYCGLFKQVLLMMVTFGIWYLIWIYRMTRYLNRVSGMERRTPVNQLLLCMFVPFYMIYWIYKSSQLIDKLGAKTGVRSNLAAPCLILSLVAGIVPHILMQGKINEIIVKENSAFDWAAAVEENLQ